MPSWLAASFGWPVYITENGLPDREDVQRPYLLATYLPEVWRLPWNWRLREQLTRTGALSNALYFLARKLSLRPWKLPQRR